MDKDFLLLTEEARNLYHQCAENQPIIDYHCHLSPREVAENKQFRSITELWLGGDHYKWRAMRANGIDERLITGDASDWEKFQAWAQTVPYTLRNPLYHWTHLELKTAFGIDRLLNAESARDIFDECNEKLKQPEFRAQGLMRHYNVEVVCTTDDPIDTLEWHQMYSNVNENHKPSTINHKPSTKMLPAWRPDKALAVGDAVAYNQYIDRLAEAADVEISSYDDLLTALNRRHDYFHSNGCRVADHGVSEFIFAEVSENELRTLFSTIRSGAPLDQPSQQKFQTGLLLELARMNARKGWVQQFHIGPLRNTRSQLFTKLGPDIGCDTMGDWNFATHLALFLDHLDRDGLLTKTILYNINPKDNAMMATMIANFQDGSVAGKMQWGSGWWFLDQKRGMEEQLNTLSLHGLLSRFVGMLTDSRSFLSYPRHEYFRRILCNLIGQDIANGELPRAEMPRIEQMIKDICYNNAKQYFGF